jgi:hypothetical protein
MQLEMFMDRMNNKDLEQWAIIGKIKGQSVILQREVNLLVNNDDKNKYQDELLLPKIQQRINGINNLFQELDKLTDSIINESWSETPEKSKQAKIYYDLFKISNRR